MRKHLLTYLVAAAVSPAVVHAQTPATSSIPAKPTEHVVGTITTIDPSFQKLSVKDDKTGTEYTVSLENTKTFLKVEPGSKDLKGAARFNPSDLHNGDRVVVRGYKVDEVPNGVAAASVILMSARDLQQAHQAEMEAWQHSTAGVVNSVDTATKQLKMTERTPAGPKTVAVDGSNARFTRYSPSTPKTPIASQLSEVQPGDQVRVIGTPNADGSIITAQKVYSGTFRTVAGTVASISPDGKELTVNNRQNHQPVQVNVTTDSAVRQLPPQMAMGLAQSPTRGSRDLSQVLERAPKISVSDLKPGEAVIVSGGIGSENSGLTATNIIVGVEPLFQAPARRGNAHSSDTGNDWNLDIAIPTE